MRQGLKGLPVDFCTSMYKNRLRVLYKNSILFKPTAIRGGAVPQEWSDSGTPKSLFFAMCRKKSP